MLETTARDDRARVLAGAATACLLWFAVALAALHVLRPDLVPRSHFISDYAVGDYGWVMTSAFLALSAACATLAVGLALSGPGGPLAGLSSVLFGVAAVGLVITAIYETDLPGAPLTPAGDIHDITFRVNTLGIVVGALLSCLAFGRSPRWRPFRLTGGALFALVVAAAIGQVLTLRKGAPYGYANRIFAATMVAWLLATASRLRRVVAVKPSS